MDNDLKKIRKLTQFMREKGLLKLKMAQIELELHPAALLNSDPSPPNKTESKQEDKPEFSHEDMMFWSAPGNVSEETKQ